MRPLDFCGSPRSSVLCDLGIHVLQHRRPLVWKAPHHFQPPLSRNLQLARVPPVELPDQVVGVLLEPAADPTAHSTPRSVFRVCLRNRGLPGTSHHVPSSDRPVPQPSPPCDLAALPVLPTPAPRPPSTSESPSSSRFKRRKTCGCASQCRSSPPRRPAPPSPRGWLLRVSRGTVLRWRRAQLDKSHFQNCRRERTCRGGSDVASNLTC